VLFSQSRKIAFDKNDFPQAITLAKRALQYDPDYLDIHVFLGRLYAWNKRPDSSRHYFNAAIVRNGKFEDAYVGYADLEIWNNNDSGALNIIRQGLEHLPSSISLLLRKARILNNNRLYKDAIATVDTLLVIDKTNTEARALAERINDNISFNRIGLYAEYIHFDKQFPDPWNLLSFDYTRQTGIGPFTARINYARRFRDDGLQYELEAYPRISKTFYTFLNLGYSDHRVFPGWRAGFSLYANLRKGFEAELGIRYLYFSNSTFIYTGYLGKYLGSFLIGGRVYLTPGNNKNISQAYSVLVRYYYGRSNNYIGLNVGAGISPDDRLSSYQLNSTYKLATYRAELNTRYTIRQMNIITFNATILNQEYRVGEVGNQFQLGLGYARRF
jgi:YaiO family outer membrane protein